jgi:putative FmdB family regulatory protein
MPIYEYVCKACGKKSSLLFRSFSSVVDKPRCPHCNSLRLARALSRPALTRVRGSSRSASDSGELRPINPRKAVENLSRTYDESGIDAGREFDEVARRAAAGDSPETLHELVQEARRGQAKKKKGAGRSPGKP